MNAVQRMSDNRGQAAYAKTLAPILRHLPACRTDFVVWLDGLALAEVERALQTRNAGQLTTALWLCGGFSAPLRFERIEPLECGASRLTARVVGDLAREPLRFWGWVMEGGCLVLAEPPEEREA